MSCDASVTLTRDVEAALVPAGDRVTLLKGETARIVNRFNGFPGGGQFLGYIGRAGPVQVTVKGVLHGGGLAKFHQRHGHMHAPYGRNRLQPGRQDIDGRRANLVQTLHYTPDPGCAIGMKCFKQAG